MISTKKLNLTQSQQQLWGDKIFLYVTIMSLCANISLFVQLEAKKGPTRGREVSFSGRFFIIF